MPIELGVAVATSAGVFGWSVWGAQIRFWFANLVISRPKAYPRRVECASRVSPQGYPQGTAGEARARARSTRTEKAERARVARTSLSGGRARSARGVDARSVRRPSLTAQS